MSEPLTPIATRTKAAASPYVEEEDETYYNETTVVSEDESEGEPEPQYQVRTVQPSRTRQIITKHEIPRKVFHSSIGFFTVWLYARGVSHKQMIVPLSAAFVVLFLNDFIRFHNPRLNDKIVRAMWWVIRPNEVSQYNGTLYYLAGLTLVFVFLPKDISLLSVLLLSWADTAASTFGRLWGRYTLRIGDKSLAGATASFVVGTLSAALVYGYLLPHWAHWNGPGDVSWSAATSRLDFWPFVSACGAIASAAELLDLGIDDNFTVPVLSAFAIFAVVQHFRL